MHTFIFQNYTLLLAHTNMCKKILFYVAIIVLLVVFIYQSIASLCSVYAQEPEIKYKQQLGSKGSENGQFRTPHSLL